MIGLGRRADGQRAADERRVAELAGDRERLVGRGDRELRALEIELGEPEPHQDEEHVPGVAQLTAEREALVEVLDATFDRSREAGPTSPP